MYVVMVNRPVFVTAPNLHVLVYVVSAESLAEKAPVLKRRLLVRVRRLLVFVLSAGSSVRQLRRLRRLHRLLVFVQNFLGCFLYWELVSVEIVQLLGTWCSEFVQPFVVELVSAAFVE